MQWTSWHECLSTIWVIWPQNKFFSHVKGKTGSWNIRPACHLRTLSGLYAAGKNILNEEILSLSMDMNFRGHCGFVAWRAGSHQIKSVPWRTAVSMFFNGALATHKTFAFSRNWLETGKLCNLWIVFLYSIARDKQKLRENIQRVQIIKLSNYKMRCTVYSKER